MKLKKDFILREIMGDVVLVPINQSTSQFNGLITVNELGKFIWENIESSNDEDELLQRILDEFLQVLKDMDII